MSDKIAAIALVTIPIIVSFFSGRKIGFYVKSKIKATLLCLFIGFVVVVSAMLISHETDNRIWFWPDWLVNVLLFSWTAVCIGGYFGSRMWKFGNKTIGEICVDHPLLLMGTFLCLMIALLPGEHIGKSYVYDLAEYHGKIMPFQKFEQGGLMIEVPLEDALNWGRDAIIIYNEKELHIWRPVKDNAGMFQHASIVTKHIHNHMYMWKIAVENNKIRLFSFYPIGWVLIWCAILAGALNGLWGPIAESAKKERDM